LVSTANTTSMRASVTMVALMPERRAIARPMTAAMSVVTTTATIMASGAGSSTPARPNGASGMVVPLTRVGALRMAEMYAAMPANDTWASDRTPELPEKICRPITRTMFMSSTMAVFSCEPPRVA